MKKQFLACVVTTATAASIGLMVPASAAVTLDAEGTGSVGGDAALRALDWTNDRLQTSAAELGFVAETVAVATTSWECVQESTGQVTGQERRTRTTARTDLVAAVERSGRTGAVTGFRLQGFADDPVSVAVVEGPDLGTCPEGGDWSPVMDSTGWAATREEPALELVHGGVTHRLPVDRTDAA